MSETNQPQQPAAVKRVPRVKNVSAKKLVVGTKRPKKPTPIVIEPTLVDAITETVNEVEALVDAVNDAVDEGKINKKKKAVEAISISTAELRKIVSEFSTKIQEDKASTGSVKNTELKNFLKDVNRRLKKLEASSSKLNKKKVSHRSTDSGFKIPVKISQEIAEFCSWDIETPRARIDVTNYICKYIKENDLQNPANRKIIVPDDRLQKLLAHNEEQHGSLTYASIQKLLAPHYTKITADA